MPPPVEGLGAWIDAVVGAPKLAVKVGLDRLTGAALLGLCFVVELIAFGLVRGVIH